MKPTFWQRVIDAWPIIVTLVGICATWWVQINMIEYRLTRTEIEITAIRTDAKENLEKLAASVQRLQLDVQTLVTLMQRDRVSNH